ncbi:MAG TPA: phage holin family protein [Pyrinomonadaceae bacterium]|nr:phage holin family protein [Pyrinomonadaceae bacterium]
MAATKTSLVTTDDGNTRGEIEQLPTLFSKLGDDVMQLFNSQLALFKVEIKEEANAFTRGATFIALGAVIAAVGFALLNVAVAFGVSTLFAQANFSQAASYALGFVVTGVFYLIAGIVVVAAIRSWLAKQQLVPKRTVAELRKDKEWLKNEL